MCIRDRDEGRAGDFVKQLAPDYKFFDWGYRIYVSSEQVPEPDQMTSAIGWITRIIRWFRGGKQGPMPAMPLELTPNTPVKPHETPLPVEQPPAPAPAVESASERLA